MSNDKDTLIGFMLNTVSVFKFHSLQIGTVIFDQTIMIILWTHLNRTHYLCNIVFNAIFSKWLTSHIDHTWPRAFNLPEWVQNCQQRGLWSDYKEISVSNQHLRCSYLFDDYQIALLNGLISAYMTITLPANWRGSIAFLKKIRSSSLFIASNANFNVNLGIFLLPRHH